MLVPRGRADPRSGYRETHCKRVAPQRSVFRDRDARLATRARTSWGLSSRQEHGRRAVPYEVAARPNSGSGWVAPGLHAARGCPPRTPPRYRPSSAFTAVPSRAIARETPFSRLRTPSGRSAHAAGCPPSNRRQWSQSLAALSMTPVASPAGSWRRPAFDLRLPRVDLPVRRRDRRTACRPVRRRRSAPTGRQHPPDDAMPDVDRDIQRRAFRATLGLPGIKSVSVRADFEKKRRPDRAVAAGDAPPGGRRRRDHAPRTPARGSSYRSHTTAPGHSRRVSAPFLTPAG